MKRFLLFLMIILLFTVSCTIDKEARIIKKLEKRLEDYNGYKTTTQIKIITDNKKSLYTIDESYIGEDINLKIMEPEISSGITIKYENNNIFLENSSISQSISLKAIKSLNKDLIVGELYRNINIMNSIEEENVEGINCYKIKCKLKEKNKYNSRKIIYLKKKDFSPLLMKILDQEDKERVIIKYKNFNFLKNEKN